jgi:hypothetical protein
MTHVRRRSLVALSLAFVLMAPAACSGDESSENSSSNSNNNSSNGSSQQNQNQGNTNPRVGEPCATEGSVGFADGGVTICDSGKNRYAMPEDLPETPVGEKPEWYPSLSTIFPSPQGVETPECNPDESLFTSPVIPVDQLAPSMPYGMMIFDHVTPIDHMYLGVATLSKDPSTLTDADFVPVTAPGPGTIIEVSTLGSPTSNRVTMVHPCGVVSVYLVLNKLTGVLAEYADEVAQKGYAQVSVPVQAGDEFGQQRDNPLDFNIFEENTWLDGFANPYSYAFGEPWKPYTADPFPYFTPELKAAYEAVMQRVEEPRIGIIDHDVVGSAAGSWYLDGTIGYSGVSTETVRAATTMIPGNSAMDGRTTYAYGHLTFAQHPVDPTQWIFSTGWWTNPAGDPRQTVIELADGQLAPDALEGASGVVVYQVSEQSLEHSAGFTKPFQSAPDGIGYKVISGRPLGWVVVQVVDDETVAIEVVADPAAQPTGFTEARRTYHR